MASLPSASSFFATVSFTVMVSPGWGVPASSFKASVLVLTSGASLDVSTFPSVPEASRVRV